MSTADVIDKYMEVVKNNCFIDYEKDFVAKITSALSKGYIQGSKEPKLVECVRDVVNSVNNLDKKCTDPYFALSTKSVFIHHYRSQVEFNYYNEQDVKRELGDLLFIASVFFKGKKYFEKLTINQFKKDQRVEKVQWDLTNKKQLFLLSRFPVFKGIKGSLIEEKVYALPDFSRSLGSYGLLFKPGDFAYVSAIPLSCYLGQKNYLRLEELSAFNNLWSDCGIERNISLYIDLGKLKLAGDFLNSEILSNCRFSPNVADFVHNYLRLRVGEPVILNAYVHNPRVKEFLTDLLAKVNEITGKTEFPELSKLISQFPQSADGKDNDKGNSNEEFEADENQGMGIIYFRLDLGE